MDSLSKSQRDIFEEIVSYEGFMLDNYIDEYVKNDLKTWNSPELDTLDKRDKKEMINLIKQLIATGITIPKLSKLLEEYIEKFLKKDKELDDYLHSLNVSKTQFKDILSNYDFKICKEILSDMSNVSKIQSRSRGNISRRNTLIDKGGTKYILQKEWPKIKQSLHSEGFSDTEIEEFKKNHYFARSSKPVKKKRSTKKKRSAKKKRSTKKKN